jgi:ribonuclease G
MTREILVNVTPHETRVALVEDGLAQELFIERAGRRGLVGNLYKGRVARVMPGMQAAFVDIGLERNAFLHVSDVAHAAAADAAPDIGALLHDGDELLVQVIKDPLGGKGARLSTLASLASRLLVYMPRGSGAGVSSRIADAAERERLRTEMRALANEGGFVVRTAAVGASSALLTADMQYLTKLWARARARYAQVSAGTLVYEELPLSLRVLRDEFDADVGRVLVDSAAEQARLYEFAGDFLPDALSRIQLHAEARPLFALHEIEDEIQRALERRVPLPSGGNLVIEQTEAMTTIDVNTGAYVGHRDLEQTAYRTNLEAASVIARQLRLRNLGGVIIVDFIDMGAGQREQLLAALRTALASDRTRTEVEDLAAFGLVAMTRKRTRESLEQLLCEPCQQCGGRGFHRSAESVCHEIYRELLRQGGTFPGQPLRVLAHPAVIERLEHEQAPLLSELAVKLGSAPRLQAEALHGLEQFDVIVG